MMVQQKKYFYFKKWFSYFIGLPTELKACWSDMMIQRKIKNAVKCIIFKWTPLKSLTAH